MPEWLCAGGQPVTSSWPFGLMGILNVTPDSFYDGASHQNLKAAMAHTKTMLAEGAAIIDIGAESTRPGSQPVDEETERNRLGQVLENVAQTFPYAIISVDTWRASTASFALAKGARIINDVSGFAQDSCLLEVLADFAPGYVLTHSRDGVGGNADVVDADGAVDIVRNVKKFFEISLARLIKAGLPENRIALDPGIGFGKTPRQNITILKNLGEFLVFNRPLLIGLSMKSIFGAILGVPLKMRSIPTAVASVLAWQSGVFWHRVHHVAEARDALLLADALKK